MKYEKTKQLIFLTGTQRKIIQRLQSNGSLQFMKLVDEQKNTALHYAASLGYLFAIQLYLKLLKNSKLWESQKDNQRSQQSIRYKIKNWLNAENQDGLTAMHFAALKGHTKIAQLLENAGAKVNKTTKSGLNVFSLAAQQNKLQSLLYFKGKIDSNASDNKKCTALHWAVFKGHETIVKYLVYQNQVLIDFKQQQGRTALHIAVLYGYTRIVQILLMAGANRHIYDKNHKLPKDYAEQIGKQKILYMLTKRQKKYCRSIYSVSPVKKQTFFNILFIFFILAAFIGSNILLNDQTDHIDNYQQSLTLIDSLFLNSPFFIYSPVLFSVVSLILALFIHFRGSKIKQHSLSYLAQNIQTSQNYCFKCKIIATQQQTTHCYKCNQCVHLKFRHSWIIGKCIGSHNLWKYFFCIVLLVLTLAVEIVMATTLLNYILHEQSDKFTVVRYLIMTIDFLCIIPIFLCLRQLYKIIKFKRKLNTISALKKLSQSTFDSHTTFIANQFKDITINKSGGLSLKRKKERVLKQ